MKGERKIKGLNLTSKKLLTGFNMGQPVLLIIAPVYKRSQQHCLSVLKIKKKNKSYNGRVDKEKRYYELINIGFMFRLSLILIQYYI